MKKNYILLFIAVIAIVFGSCEAETDTDAGGTSTEDMAGQWYVTFEQSLDEYNSLFLGSDDPELTTLTADELDELSWSDLYGTGSVSVYTFNTADESTDSLWFADYSADSDDAAFWQYKVKVGMDLYDGTFSCDETANTSYDGCNITVLGGKILEDAATTPRGYAADSIIAYVYFSDDYYGFTYMKMSGYRYTGFEDDK
jgi:hypothetical protein